MRHTVIVLLAGLSSLTLAGVAQAQEASNALANRVAKPANASLAGASPSSGTSMRLGQPAPASPYGQLGNKLDNPGAAAATRDATLDGKLRLGQPDNGARGFGNALMASPTGQSIGAGMSNSLSDTRVSMANELSSSSGRGSGNGAILGLTAGPDDTRGGNAALSNRLTLGK